MAVQDKICPYHYEHHAAIEKLQSDADKLYSKVNAVEKSVVKIDADFPQQLKEQKNRVDNLQSDYKKKFLQIKYRAYVYATTSGIIGAIVIKLLELLYKLIAK